MDDEMGDMGMDDEMGDEVDLDMGDDMDDEFAGDDATVGGDEPTGREMKAEI